jgi:protein gp37
MADKSKIEWTDATWNPIRGCSRVSEGCRNCYAERIAARFSGPGQPYEGTARRSPQGEGGWTGEVRFVPEVLEQPLRWKHPRRIFVNSMSDLFHENVQPEWFAKIWGVMIQSPQHTFQILTKRPAIMRECLKGARRSMGKRHNAEFIKSAFGLEFPLRNIWLGVSVENQNTADERIPILLDTPAAVRFVSYEPALGPVDVRHIQHDGLVEIDALTGDHGVYRPLIGRAPGNKLHWIIAGGESRPGARPAHPDWFRSVRDQCLAAGVPFFFKQWGEWISVDQRVLVGDARLHRGMNLHGIRMLCAGKKSAGRLLDGREWNGFPKVAE